MGEPQSRDAAVLSQLWNALGGFPPERVAVLCVGNPARGDDGYGPALAHALEGRTNAPVFDAGGVPENDLPRVASLQPRVVLLVDAVHFGGRPGELRLMDTDELRSDDLSTHCGSPLVLEKFLVEACGCRVMVMAAQPADTEMGDDLSAAMRGAVERTARLLQQVLGGD